MAYINRETKKVIAEALKPICKKYGVKATFGVRHHSTFVMNIASGGIDFIGNHNGVCDVKRNNEHIQVNPYWIDSSYSGVAKEFLNEVVLTIKTAGEWYDNSDSQIDYFDTKYFFDINIGRWNKPYSLTF